MHESDLLKLAVEVGSFSLMTWLMLQTFSKTLPTLTEQYRQDLQREREASERGMMMLSSQIEKLSILIIYHDATVRGKNPETVGSTEEILRILRHQPRGEVPSS